MTLTPLLTSKKCCTCKEELPIDSFYFRSDTKKPRSDCKQCVNAKAAKRWDSDEEFRTRGKKRSRVHALKSFYGISEDDYERMFREQEGKCAICSAMEPGHSRTKFCVDHDHKSGAVRGLLCVDCNTTLGKFNDEIERFYKAARYLEATQPSNT